MYRVLASLLCALMLASACTSCATLGRKELRASAASHVLLLEDKEATGSGTGFVLVDADGRQRVVTNAHVCAMMTDGHAYVQNQDERVALKVVRSEPAIDLCELEAPRGHDGGLRISSQSAEPGDQVHAVGHPAGMPLTMTGGEMVAVTLIPICELVAPGMAVCQQFVAMLTTIQVLGGSSGSPMVNDSGEVVGVIFGGGPNGWAVAVPRELLLGFLAPAD